MIPSSLPSYTRSAICLGNTFDLILLLDGVAVRGLLGTVHDFVGQALRNGFDVTESAVPGARADEIDRLVDASQWRHIHSLPPNNARRADARRVLPWAAVLHRVHNNLDRVL